MGSKYSRSGGKFSGNHTTLIPAACTIADIAHACESVYKISPGIIKAGLRSVSGKRRLKVSQNGDTYLLLQVRDNASQQQVHVYTNDLQGTVNAIAEGARDAGLLVKV